jgi:hypothetical protein
LTDMRMLAQSALSQPNGVRLSYACSQAMRNTLPGSRNPLINKEEMQHPDPKTLYSSHAVIALAILGVVVVAVAATPDVTLVISAALAKMAEAAASTVRP